MDHLRAERAAEGKRVLSLTVNCPTRFGSIPHMLNRLIENRLELLKIMEECPITGNPQAAP